MPLTFEDETVPLSCVIETTDQSESHVVKYLKLHTTAASFQGYSNPSTYMSYICMTHSITHRIKLFLIPKNCLSYFL